MSQVATKHLHQYEVGETHVEHTTGWTGWVGFAAIVMILEGLFQGIAGLVGIFRSSFYLITNHSSQMLVFSNIHAWSWANLIVGIVVLLAGISLFSGATWARVVATIMAVFAAVANLLAITLYPLWSIIGITLSVLVIYAVIAHGGEMKEY